MADLEIYVNGVAGKQVQSANDNAMAENFFSILKTECIYRHKPATFAEANEMIDRYICFYNHERIQLKTGEAPLARRLSVSKKSFRHAVRILKLSKKFQNPV